MRAATTFATRLRGADAHAGRWPLLQRCWLHAADVWQGWCARRLERHTLRALAGLGERTLRDIGMQGRVPPRDGRMSVFDIDGRR